MSFEVNATTPSFGKVGQEQDAKKAATGETIAQANLGLAACKDSLASYDQKIEGVKGPSRFILKGLSKIGKAIVGKAEKSLDKVEASRAEQEFELPTRPTLDRPLSNTPVLRGYNELSVLDGTEEAEEIMIQEDEDRPSSTEKGIFKAMGAQAIIYERANELTSELIQKKSEENEVLMKAYLDAKEEAERKKKRSSLFSWTGLGAGILGTIFGIGGTIAALATGGAALPIVLGLGSGIASVASGASEIGKGVFKGLSEKAQAEGFEAKQNHTLNTEKMQKYFEDLSSTDASLEGVWSNMSRILSNIPRAFRQ